MNVNDFIPQRLGEWKIEKIFCYPGDGINGLLGAMNRNQSISFIQTRHEEMAAFIACAHAKFTINMRHMKKKIAQRSLILITGILLGACGGKNTGSNVQAPGGEKTGKDKVLETGADLIQQKTPLNNFNTYLDGFHFYNDNINAQMEAHHYVQQLNEAPIPYHDSLTRFPLRCLH